MYYSYYSDINHHQCATYATYVMSRYVTGCEIKLMLRLPN